MPRLPSAWYHERTLAHSITSTSNTSRCKGPHFLCRATAAISFHLTARTAHLRVRREMLLSRVLLDMTKAHPCAVATPMPHRVVSALMLLAKPLPARGLDYSQSLDSFSSDRFARGERARFSKVTRSGRIQPIVEPTPYDDREASFAANSRVSSRPGSLLALGIGPKGVEAVRLRFGRFFGIRRS